MGVMFYSLEAQHADYLEELKAASERLIDSNYFIGGPEVEKFESEWADYCGRKFAIGVGNGLDAISLVLRALDLNPEKKVVTVANSFVASALGVTLANRLVDLVDCGEDYLIDVAAVEKLDPTEISCLIPVHLYGQMAEMDRLEAWAKANNVLLLEDAAQCHGAHWKERKPGQGSVAATFSFYPTKNLGALGDAGAIVTDDETLAKKLRMLRAYGSTVKYHHDMLGVNSRLDPLQAAFLSVKLKHLDRLNGKRTEIASHYDTLLKAIPGVTIPITHSEGKHVYHQYVIQAENRSKLVASLEKKGVQTLIHYPIPIHKTKAYEKMLSHVSAPRTERMAEEILSLPMWPGMTSEMCEYVASHIREFYEQSQ